MFPHIVLQRFNPDTFFSSFVVKDRNWGFPRIMSTSYKAKVHNFGNLLLGEYFLCLLAGSGNAEDSVSISLSGFSGDQIIIVLFNVKQQGPTEESATANSN